MKLFTKRKYGRWEDVALVTSSGDYKLIQCRTCELTGKRQFTQRPLGFVNDPTIIPEINKYLKNGNTV